MMLESALGWYQGRISLYDKQSWETTVEQRILQGLSYTPRKTTKLKTELIDVDLVRGSTFPKAKPQSGIWIAGLQGVTRLILLPLYGHWWIRETSCSGFLTVLFLYVSVLFSAVMMFSCRHDGNLLKNVPASEVYLPGAVMLALSIIHSQIVCTRNSGVLSSPSHKNRPLGIRQSRRVRSLRRSSSLSGRGKCLFCSNLQPPDKSRQQCNTSKLSLTVLKTKPSLKMFRSHSEEPRQEETYPLQPRSSSENNVFPVSSKERPNIIIIQPTSEASKQDELWSSSAPTSSSERSPVISQADSFIDNFDVQHTGKTDINVNCKAENLINFPAEKSTDFLTANDSFNSSLGCKFRGNFGSRMSDIESDMVYRSRFQSHSQKNLKLSNDVESDGGESGMGEMEDPASAKTSWNVRRMNRCTRCSQVFDQASDCSATPTTRDKLPSPALERSSCNSSCESDAEQGPSLKYSKSKISRVVCCWRERSV